MIVKRVIKQNVQEYEYKGKEVKFDDYIQLRIETWKKQKLKEIAQAKGYKNYSALVKEAIDGIIENNK